MGSAVSVLVVTQMDTHVTAAMARDSPLHALDRNGGSSGSSGEAADRHGMRIEERYAALPPLPVPLCEVIGTSVGMPQCAPRIVIIGAMKCGTNAVADFLEEHPNVQGSEENHYFSIRYKPGVDPREEPDFLRWQPLLQSSRPRRLLTIDRSPSYLQSPEVAARYKAQFPDAKVIAIVCDPVTRLISNYWHYRRFDRFNEHYQAEAFDQTVEQWVGLQSNASHPVPVHCTAESPDDARFAPAPHGCANSACTTSEYTHGLLAWVRAFGEDNVFITEQEALKRTPAPIVARMFQFLRLDPADAPGAFRGTRAVFTNAAKPKPPPRSSPPCPDRPAVSRPPSPCRQGPSGPPRAPPMNVTTAWVGSCS